MDISTREHWLNTSAIIMQEEIITPVIDLPPPPVRYSLTAPSMTTKKGQVLGECWNRAASSDGHNEIFITANLGEQDSVKILATTLHEQLHAYDNNQHGHRGIFIHLCKLVGLKGGPNGRVAESYTSTVPTQPLQEHLEDIVLSIGPIPHAAMSAEKSGKKIQKNRQLLVVCSHCDFKFRASQKAIDSITNPHCPACVAGFLAQQ